MDFDQGKGMVLAEDPVAAFEPSDYYYGGNNWRQYCASLSGIFATAGLKFELSLRYKRESLMEPAPMVFGSLL
jgi:hypothetical protein